MQNFLAEEIRNDYLITSEMKKLWSVQLDLLKKFDEVCKKHKLKYFAIGGTLLGAVRHSGYIPWDDDIDLGMMRNDYDRLIEVAETEFNHPYFLQSAYSDIDYANLHIKLRNSDTLCATKYDFEFKYNKGVFIDIFPLDRIPDLENDRISFVAETKKYQRILNVGIRKFYRIGEEIISETEKNEIMDYLKKYLLRKFMLSLKQRVQNSKIQRLKM